MEKNTPFIQRFQTEKNYYIYDVNTNKILNIDQIIYDILEYYRLKSTEEIIQKLSKKYSPENIRKKIDEIKLAKKTKNIFSSHRPKKMAFYESTEEIITKLETELKHLVLNITEQCNLRCEYCGFSGHYFYERTHSDKKMDINLAKKAIDFYMTHSVQKTEKLIGFYGGESLLEFTMIQSCIEYCKKNYPKEKIIYHFTTNGTLLTENVIQYLIKHPVEILVSLDGPKHIHDRFRKFRNGKATYNIIMKNLKKFKELDNDFYKKMIAFEAVRASDVNPLEIVDYFSTNELTKGHRVTLTTISPVDTTFFDIHQFDKKIDIVKIWNELKTEYIKQVIQNPYDVNPLLDRNFSEPFRRLTLGRVDEPIQEKIRPSKACIPGVSQIFVSVDGDIFICEKMGIKKNLRIGTINTGFDIKKILHLMNKYCIIRSPHCINCWAVRLCGLCFVPARKDDKLDINRLLTNCPQERGLLHMHLVDYTRILEQNPDVMEIWGRDNEK